MEAPCSQDARSQGARSQAPVGIDAFSIEGLAQLCKELGQPAFRGKQLLQWLYGKKARSYEEMTNLPEALRERLAQEHPLHFPKIVAKQVSEDGTRKYLLKFGDGVSVETVGLPTESRLTVCFSTQAGCAMGCSFCATGQSGLLRSLTPGEMVWQLLVVEEDFGRRVSNAVAMGQGEPFANYDNTLAALRIMNAKDGLMIGARHLTVSTCGILGGIRRFAQEPEQFTLAISLHAAIQETRDKIMPKLAGVYLSDLRKCCIDYSNDTGRRPSYEYALISGINDDQAHLDALIDFCQGTLCHVNIIPVNPVLDNFIPGSEQSLARFQRDLSARGIENSVRTPRGADIDGACGQLRQRTDS